MHCKSCHYSLENLTEHRCPECGQAFDPADPSSFDSQTLQSIRNKRFIHVVSVLVWAGMGVFFILVARRQFQPAFALAAIICIVATVIMFTHYRRESEPLQ